MNMMPQAFDVHPQRTRTWNTRNVGLWLGSIVLNLVLSRNRLKGVIYVVASEKHEYSCHVKFNLFCNTMNIVFIHIRMFTSDSFFFMFVMLICYMLSFFTLIQVNSLLITLLRVEKPLLFQQFKLITKILHIIKCQVSNLIPQEFNK